MSSIVLLPVFGDQLSPNLSSLRNADTAHSVIVMAEVAEEATYVAHHKKKIAFVFAAMRAFARELVEDGWTVEYTRIDDTDPPTNLKDGLARAVARHDPCEIVLTHPNEWRLADEAKDWQDALCRPVTVCEDDRFLCSRAQFESWAEGRKQLRMEYFYREMRRRTGLLMDGDDPVGGKWNFDNENRKPPPGGLLVPRPPRYAPDATTQSVLDAVDTKFGDHFGELEPFWFATTRKQAAQALDQFIEAALPNFGDFQDAMLTEQPFLYHSVLSQYLNVGLLDPMTMCKRAEIAYHSGHAPLNAVEGFIRQIIGWREYVRGIYWMHMPAYRNSNHLSADRALPGYYWTGKTKMACMAAAIGQTRDEAYAHHIQRLMITGNFALLAGIDPHELHEWYLAVYADAYEWVELPNTIGMSQFADGGLLASKPYAASGNYINKMSDYCSGCAYDAKAKNGPTACPFNPLYWDFVARNEAELRSNPRMGPVYRTWDRMADDKKMATRSSAARILDDIETL